MSFMPGYTFTEVPLKFETTNAGYHKGTSIYCHERFKCKANGAQKPERTQST